MYHKSEDERGEIMRRLAISFLIFHCLLEWNKYHQQYEEEFFDSNNASIVYHDVLLPHVEDKLKSERKKFQEIHIQHSLDFSSAVFLSIPWKNDNNNNSREADRSEDEEKKIKE